MRGGGLKEFGLPFLTETDNGISTSDELISNIDEREGRERAQHSTRIRMIKNIGEKSAPSGSWMAGRGSEWPPKLPFTLRIAKDAIQ